VTLVGLSQVRGPIWVLYGGYFALGMFGAGTGYLAYSRAVTTWFDRGRGLAMALTMAGTAIAAVLIPLLLPRVVAAHGWRGGYLALSASALVAVPLFLLFVRERKVAIDAVVGRGSGATVHDAIRTREFWLMAVGIFSVGLGLVAWTLHLMPMLIDMGATPTRASYALSLFGVGVLAGRMISGAMLDSFFAPLVASFLFCVPPAGFAIFHVIGVSFGPALGLMLGLATGAEADVLGYLASRYFGLKSYSEIFGWLYGAMAVGSACSPLLIGMLFSTVWPVHYLLGGVRGVLCVRSGFIRMSRAIPAVG
jgi:MFS family permease